MKEQVSQPADLELDINNNEALKIPSDDTIVVAGGDGTPKYPINGKKKPKLGFFRSALVKLRQRPTDKPKTPAAKDEVIPHEKLKNLVGSMRPLHLQHGQSPPRSEPPMSPKVDVFADIAVAPPSPAASYSSVLSGGTMSQYASASNLQELDSSLSHSGSSSNLQELDHKHDATLSQSVSTSDLQQLEKREAPMRRFASTINLQELDHKHGHHGKIMRHSASTSNLQELGNQDMKDPDEVLEALFADEMIDAKAEEFIARFYLQMRLQSQNRRRRKGKDKI